MNPIDIDPPQLPEISFPVLLVNHYKEIVETAFRDLEFVTTFENNPRLQDKYQLFLKQGIWSPDDYWRASQKWGLNPSQDLLKTYRKGYLPDHIFSKRRDFTFKLNEGLLPSEAIMSIGKNLSLLDSGSIYMLAFHRALCEFIGPSKFDRIFGIAEEKLEPPVIGSPDVGPEPILSSPEESFEDWEPFSPKPQNKHRFFFSNKPNIRLTSHLFEFKTIDSSDEIRVGDRCCFKNSLFFSAKHKISEEFIAICNESKTFLGLGLPPGGSTREQVEQMMLKTFNQAPLLEEKNILAKHTLTWEQFQAVTESPPYRKEGKLFLEIVRPNIERITKLGKESLDVVQQVFNEKMGEESIEKKRKTS